MLVSNGAFVAATGPNPTLPYDELAAITPIAAFGAYYGGGSINLSGLQASYAAIYKAQLWAYVLINKRAKAVSRLEYKVNRNAPDGSLVEASDTLYAQLMARPNRLHNPVSFWTWVMATRDIYGEAIAVKVRDPQGRVREIWPMHPTNTITYRGEDGRWQYVFSTGARNVPLLPPMDESDVIHWRRYNPENTERGLSPIEPLRQTLLNEDASRRAATAMWKNGARPSMALTTPGKLSDAAYARLQATWDNRNSGVDNWAKTAILEEGLTPSPISLNAEELQYIASRQLNREEVCAAYDMPPSSVHILDHATYSNITEQGRMVYRDSIGPECRDLEATLQHQLVPDFSRADGDIVGGFDMSDVLGGTFQEQVTAFAQGIQTGQLKPQEARRRLKLPDAEGADQLLVNAALIPLKVIETVSVGTGADINLVPQRVKALTPQQARTVQGRLSRAESVASLNPTTVSQGLDDAEQTVLALVNAAQARGADLPQLRQWINATVDLGDQPKELTA